jgi:chromosomal replication initiator protein
MSETPKPATRGDCDHPLWSSLLLALRHKLTTEQVVDLAQHVRVLEISPSSLSLAVHPDHLRRWLRDGRLRIMDSCLGRLTDYASDLAVTPMRSSSTDWPGAPRTLQSFAASPANEEARRRTAAIVQEPCRHANPLLLYGPTCSGKTHLLCAIAHGLAQKVPAKTLLLLRAEELSLELISAIRADQLDGFRRRLHGCSALLVDDIHRLAGRKASQQELASALTAVDKNRVQVVFTSSAPTAKLQPLEKSLRAQLAHGEDLELHPPEWETRVAIVLEHIAHWEVEARPEVASLIVSKLGNDLHRLDALLTRIMTHPLSDGRVDDLPTLRRILSEGVRRTGQLPPETVLSTVTHHFNIRLSDLRSSARSPRVTTPRQIAMYLVRRHCGLSYPDIGLRFRRHHTTALHACRRIEHERDRNTGLHTTLSLLEKELRRLAETGG